LGFEIEFFPIFLPVPNAIDPFIKVGPYGFGRLADFVPIQVKIIVPVIISLGV
jgi:hypothetical protein